MNLLKQIEEAEDKLYALLLLADEELKEDYIQILNVLDKVKREINGFW